MKQLLMICGTLALLANVARSDGPKDNNPDNVRQVPPPGIEVSDEDRGRLQQQLQELKTRLTELRKRDDPLSKNLMPDVEIFYRAVDQALRYDEFFAPGDIRKAEQVLEEGLSRASALLQGKAPWMHQRGLVVRGFRSRLDGTVQPYGLVVPEGYRVDGEKSYRCDLWFHGRGERNVEVQFIHQRMTSRGRIAPAETIVVHPFARYSNGNKFAGEIDTLEALAHAEQYYRIDPERTSVRGFSMGGAACWHLAVHYADRWFAATPGAGFSETPDFLRTFQNEELHPTWWEKKLWRLYDCPDWVENLIHCPTIAYSGEIDSQKQAADIMEVAFENAGMDMVHIIGPQTAHTIHPDSAQEIERRLASLAERGRERFPQAIQFVTYTLKYNRMHWLTVDALGQHWERAFVRASCPGRACDIEVTTENVTAMTLEFPAGWCPMDLQSEVTLNIDGNRMTAPRPKSDRSWRCQLHKDDTGRWQIGPRDTTGLVKKHNLQGPIDDALMDSFLFVAPDGASTHEMIEAWTQAELQHAIDHWRQQMRGDVRIKRADEVTDEDIARHHLILWGDASSNQLIQRVLPDLPVRWTAESIGIGEKDFAAATHVPAMIYPNSLNPERYVVLNSSFTYREYDYLNNARQVPKLPDWAIIDASEGSSSRWPGRITDADFFDESWQVRPVAVRE
ncbi:hypothetical protein Mal4_28190 [Maioricimonas rarisocia]|uniref:Prolyl oligopeptidase family protein n=1 Tax=Maioricimonas rarisocia TaxID=2528026 RepID=A0A517Z7S4_9PLAN|nr:hypothetical protein [Maioricimonas rarisocia]QDU38491.1 hypothetical protein Mal4_28190 [Maioricimonas rarisocia]